MITAADHDYIVAGFYASAAGETPWASTLAHMANLFGSSGTILGIHRPESAEVLTVESHNYSRDFLISYFDSEVYANDPRMPHVLRIPKSRVYHDEMLYDVREIEQSPWVKASLDMLGVFDLTGVALALPDGGAARLAMLRTRREGRVSCEGVAAFARLVPEIGRACTLGHVIEREAGARAMLLDKLAAKSEALILLDRLGGTVFMNDAADRILSARDGLEMRQGQFVAHRPPETRRLNRLVGEALRCFRVPGRAGGGEMLVSRPSRRRPYLLSILPTPGHEAFLTGRSIVCVLMIKDLDSPPAPTPESLRAIFGLSAREADLAAQLVRSPRLDEAAARCGMAVNTARNHLQSIFRKTEVRSQAEAVQLFGRLP